MAEHGKEVVLCQVCRFRLFPCLIGFPVKLHVVEGQRGPLGELLGEPEFVLSKSPRLRRVHHGDGPDDFAAGVQRDRRKTRRTERAEKLPIRFGEEVLDDPFIHEIADERIAGLIDAIGAV